MTMNISTKYKYTYDLEYLYDNGYLHFIYKKIYTINRRRGAIAVMIVL